MPFPLLGTEAQINVNSSNILCCYCCHYVGLKHNEIECIMSDLREFRISCSEWLIVAVGVVLEFWRFSMSMILRMMARYYQSAVTADIGPTDPWYKKCRGPVLCWFVEIHWEYWTTCLTLGSILLNPWWSGGVSDNTLLNLNPPFGQKNTV